MNQKEVYKETLANTIIKNLETENMEGLLCKTAHERRRRERCFLFMEDGSSVSWGGSATLVDAGIIDAVYESGSIRLLIEIRLMIEYRLCTKLFLVIIS